jgi:hypothetical protein
LNMKTLQATIIAFLLATSINAYPILGTTGIVGNTRCHPIQQFQSAIRFDNSFGGHWDLTGKDTTNANGSHTDSFKGTMTDTSIHRTYTQADFDWISDGWFLCSHAQILCSSFSITISNGKVTGWATYTP